MRMSSLGRPRTSDYDHLSNDHARDSDRQSAVSLRVRVPDVHASNRSG